MAFRQNDVEDLLLRCRRHCCVCRKFKGVLVEVHHIDASLVERRDDIDNAIAVCGDCHAMIGHYNTEHPRGRKYRPAELRKLRDAFIKQLQTQSQNNLTDSAIADVVQTVTGNGNTVVAGDYIANRRITVRSPFSPTDAHINESTAYRIKSLVEDLAALDAEGRKPPANPHQKWWSKLKRQFKVSTYRAIPSNQGERAVGWLQQQKALLRPKLRRASPSIWKNEHYKAIYARCKELGIDKERLYLIASERLELGHTIDSLTTLGERDLQRLHRIIFSI